MSWVIGLESYRVVARHGAFDFEREQAQPFVISLSVTLQGESNPTSGLEHTIDYGLLQTIVDEEVRDGPHAPLMENLCERLVNRLSVDSRVAAIKVRIEKPEAPLPHPGGLPVVEHLWSRD